MNWTSPRVHLVLAGLPSIASDICAGAERDDDLVELVLRTGRLLERRFCSRAVDDRPRALGKVLHCQVRSRIGEGRRARAPST